MAGICFRAFVLMAAFSLEATVVAGADERLDPVVFHKKPAAAAAPSPAAGGPVSAERLQETISNAAETAGEVLHNTEVERDMLQTQLLANGEGLHVIKKLAETVAKMKSQVETLENHERVCQKKLADLRAGQNQVEEDNALANTVTDDAF